MNKSIYSFDFKCPDCKTRQTIHEKYDENKIYICPGCDRKGSIPIENRIRTTKLHPYTFQCPYCNNIQRTYDIDYKGEIDGYYVTECDCPGCGRHLVHNRKRHHAGYTDYNKEVFLS